MVMTGASTATSTASTTIRRAPDEVRDQQDQPPVEAVGDDARRHRQQHEGDEAGGANDAQDDRVVGDLIDDDEDRDEVEPVADGADGLADKQPNQRRVPEHAPIGRGSLHASLHAAMPAVV